MCLLLLLSLLLSVIFLYCYWHCFIYQKKVILSNIHFILYFILILYSFYTIEKVYNSIIYLLFFHIINGILLITFFLFLFVFFLYRHLLRYLWYLFLLILLFLLLKYTKHFYFVKKYFFKS